MTIKLEMPRLSESVTEGTLLRWRKKGGDMIALGDCIADLNTENGEQELLATKKGRISEILIADGNHFQAGQVIATLEPEERPYSSSPKPANQDNQPPRLSPLASKLAKASAIDPKTVKGSGPHGRIMAADIKKAPASSSAASNNPNYPIAKKASQEHKIISPATKQDGYYIYTFEANMSQLAEISTPIAVQCEKFIGGRYCLFDYVARAAVKAFASVKEMLNPEQNLELLMVVNRGTTDIAIPQAVKKTIHDIALNRNIGDPDTTSPPVPKDFKPDLLVCDAGARMSELKPRIKGRPTGIVFLGGTSPKTGIEAGRPVQKLMLPLTVYVDVNVYDESITSQVAAEFKSLMENPVLLLF